MSRARRAGALLTLASLLTFVLPWPLAAQETLRSFTSPTYGFTMSWDSSAWTIDEAATQLGAGAAVTDGIVLERGSARLLVLAEQRADPDPTACVANETARFEAEPGVLEIAPIGLTGDEVLAGEVDGIAYAGYERRLSDDAAPDLAPLFFVECRLLPRSGASLLFILESTPDSFVDDMAAAGEINQTLSFAAATGTPDALATPVAGEATPGPAALAEAIAAIASEPSTAGPTDGELVQAAGAATLAPVGSDAADFYLRVRFQTPATDAPWDFGVAFRHADQGNEEYRLVIDSGGGWYLTRGVETDVQTGVLQRLVTQPGGVNAFELLAEGETGWLRLNDEVIGPLDLSAITGGGPIAIGTAFFADNTTDGAVLAYRSLSVWALGGEAAAGDATPATAPAEPSPAATSVSTATAVPTAIPEADTPTAPIEPTTVPTEPAEPTVPAEPSALAEPADAVATPSSDEAPAAPDTVILAPVDDSGVSGTVQLLPFGAQSSVAVAITPPSTIAIAAIHTGTCQSFAPLLEYPLAVFDADGRSLSIIPLSASDLAGGIRVIAIHASLADFGTIVACGEIPPG